MKRWRLAVGALVVAGVLAVPEVAGATTRDQVRRPGRVRVLLVGDSNTAAYQAIAADALEARGYVVYPAGIGGIGLLDAQLCKGRWAKAALDLLDPDVVVMQWVGSYGINEKCFPKVRFGTATFYKKWTSSAKTSQRVLTRRHARFAWISMPPMVEPAWSPVVTRLNAIHRSLGPVIETWSTTAYSKPGAPHLTDEGYQRLADRVVAAVG